MAPTSVLNVGTQSVAMRNAATQNVATQNAVRSVVRNVVRNAVPGAARSVVRNVVRSVVRNAARSVVRNVVEAHNAQDAPVVQELLSAVHCVVAAAHNAALVFPFAVAVPAGTELRFFAAVRADVFRSDSEVQ